ncbi:uncharacterized protein LOC130047643 [Ostrea edulis]|uniref:uncharacterized protein LOC130047643 n=1 Tax=Ostrea edulis TaxID=37623 RepID=UPI0024AEFE86|nr:uncharacterized protein LOC130047643 [Ostrea edulis]
MHWKVCPTYPRTTTVVNSALIKPDRNGHSEHVILIRVARPRLSSVSRSQVRIPRQSGRPCWWRRNTSLNMATVLPRCSSLCESWFTLRRVRELPGRNKWWHHGRGSISCFSEAEGGSFTN